MKRDLSGQRFGRWVVSAGPEKKSGKKAWRCLCDCGTVRVVRESYLIGDRSRSCGCDRAARRVPLRHRVDALPAQAVDLTGRRFGRLVVQKVAGRRGTRMRMYWVVRCDCGTVKEVAASSLTMGRSLSCGCLRVEQMVERWGPEAVTPGMSRWVIRRSWDAMKRRCYYPGASGYENYGGRGIQVCSAWRDDFDHFCSWALGAGWAPGLTIDRVDPSGDYCPQNCRWISRAENSARSHGGST